MGTDLAVLSGHCASLRSRLLFLILKLNRHGMSFRNIPCRFYNYELRMTNYA